MRAPWGSSASDPGDNLQASSGRSATKSVYIAISSDVLHRGHLNIIEQGARLGEVTIGLLTDSAIATYKRAPLLDWETRRATLVGMRNVARVVAQDTLSYANNLREFKPDIVLHGDDWRTGVQAVTRAEVISVLAEYGGELVEVAYTEGVSGTDLEAALRPALNTIDARRGRLRKLLGLKPWLRAMEVSNGLSALIVESVRVDDPESGGAREYDAMWVSSLCDSAFKGKPDTELVDFTSRLRTIHDIMEVSTKPIILDGDTGGKTAHFPHLIRTLERVGVSAVIIEDKTWLKQNSLLDEDAVHTLQDPHAFAAKMNAGKRAQVTDDFMIIARLESLIAGQGLEDALTRARIYIEEGGVDGIMIHSRHSDGEEIREFLRRFRDYTTEIPVVLVPTTYNHIPERELSDLGADIIIHANHLLRSAYPAMLRTATKILDAGRSKEVDDEIMSIRDVVSLIPE